MLELEFVWLEGGDGWKKLRLVQKKHYLSSYYQMRLTMPDQHKFCHDHFNKKLIRDLALYSYCAKFHFPKHFGLLIIVWQFWSILSFCSLVCVVSNAVIFHNAHIGMVNIIKKHIPQRSNIYVTINKINNLTLVLHKSKYLKHPYLHVDFLPSVGNVLNLLKLVWYSSKL